MSGSKGLAPPPTKRVKFSWSVKSLGIKSPPRMGVRRPGVARAWVYSSAGGGRVAVVSREAVSTPGGNHCQSLSLM